MEVDKTKQRFQTPRKPHSRLSSKVFTFLTLWLLFLSRQKPGMDHDFGCCVSGIKLRGSLEFCSSARKQWVWKLRAALHGCGVKKIQKVKANSGPQFCVCFPFTGGVF